MEVWGLGQRERRWSELTAGVFKGRLSVWGFGEKGSQSAQRQTWSVHPGAQVRFIFGRQASAQTGESGAQRWRQNY